ncbi:MAG: polysaccharide deacetylase family protein [Candidatus Saccharibacteria bacterium]
MLILIFGFAAGLWWGTDRQHQAGSSTEPKTVVKDQEPKPDPEPKQDSKANQESDNPAKPAESIAVKTVLPILGNSNKLTAKQWKAMLVWRNDSDQTARVNQGRVYVNGPTASKQVCLTFDDGPDLINTPKILDVLKQYDVHGNFFFKGNRVRKYADVVKRADNEGNLVLSHAYSHQELNKMNAHDIDKEIWATDQAFKEIIGKSPALIRPPFGSINNDVITECSDNGERIILWSIDTLDWSQMERNNIAANVLNNVRPGDIILMHSDEDKGETTAALPAIIEGLQSQGYSIVTLDAMLGMPGYK